MQDKAEVSKSADKVESKHSEAEHGAIAKMALEGLKGMAAAGETKSSASAEKHLPGLEFTDHNADSKERGGGGTGGERGGGGHCAGDDQGAERKGTADGSPAKGGPGAHPEATPQLPSPSKETLEKASPSRVK